MQSNTFEAPCCCLENVPNTALNIVCTITVSIDCKKNKISNSFTRKNRLDCKSRQQVAWFVFCFQIKLCAKMMISFLLMLDENLKFCTMMYGMATPNAIDCCNNQTLVICIVTTNFDWMGLKCCI